METNRIFSPCDLARAAERGLICIMTVGAVGSGVGGVALYGSRRRF